MAGRPQTRDVRTQIRSNCRIRGLTADGFFRGRCGRGSQFLSVNFMDVTNEARAAWRVSRRPVSNYSTTALTPTPTCRAMQGAGVNGMNMVIRCNLHFAVGQPHTVGAGQLHCILPCSGGCRIGSYWRSGQWQTVTMQTDRLYTGGADRSLSSPPAAMLWCMRWLDAKIAKCRFSSSISVTAEV